MIIETQATSDENVLNFYSPVQLLKSGSAEFVDAKSLRKSPLAEQIFDLGGIVSVLLTPDMVSVTKADDETWDNLKPLVLAEITDYLAMGEAPVTIAIDEENDKQAIVQQIEGLLNARIRPAVKRDGGDIVYKDFKDGVVFVEMRGACAGCPYAMVTLKDGVEKILKTYIPAVKEVRQVADKKKE